MSSPFIATFNEHAEFGVAYQREFTYKDEAGDPVDVTGYTGSMLVKDRPGGTTVLTCAVSVGSTDGKVTVTATATQMAEAVPTAERATWVGHYDILLLSSGDPAIKLVQGTFTIHPTVSV